MSSLTEDRIRQASSLFKALSNPMRIRILLLVSETERPLHIKAVAEALKTDYAALYRHVKVLQRNSLIKIYEVGRSRVLSLRNEELVKQIINNANKIAQ